MPLSTSHQPNLGQLFNLTLFNLFLSLILPLSSSWGNDASFGGVGADLRPLKNHQVVMVSEDIRAVETRFKEVGSLWVVEATYVFHNPTEVTQDLTMGFPERLCNGECSSPSNDNTTFRGIQTTVKGVPVKMRTESLGAQSGWSESLGRVHLFNIHFNAKERLVIKHRYQMGISSSVEGELRFDYVTKTGALWGAPIGKASFTVSVLKRPMGLHYPEGYLLVNYESEKGLSTVRFTQDNWTPQRDLSLVFDYEMTQVFSCPDFLSYYHSLDDLLKELKIHTADPIAKPLRADSALKQALSLSPDNLKLCRNIPFARYGYHFKNQRLTQTLYRYQNPTPLLKMKRDYQSATFYHFDQDEMKHRLGILFRPSDHYSKSALSDREWKYIKLLKLIERYKSGH